MAARVPESDIGRIATGQSAEIRVDAFPDERFKAQVSEVAPRAEKQDNVTSFEVKLTLIDPPEKLLIGMTADITSRPVKAPRRRWSPPLRSSPKMENQVFCWWMNNRNHSFRRWSSAAAAVIRLRS